MFNYTLRRMLFAVAVIWAVYTVTFCLAHVEFLNPLINTLESWRGVPEEQWTKLGLADPVRVMMEPRRFVVPLHTVL